MDQERKREREMCDYVAHSMEEKRGQRMTKEEGTQEGSERGRIHASSPLAGWIIDRSSHGYLPSGSVVMTGMGDG